LRHLASGQISNRDYEKRTLISSRDVAVREIWNAAWGLYSDVRTHRLTGKHGLTADTKEAVARCILFLHSELPWEWPTRGFPASLLFFAGSVCTLGLLARWDRRRYRAAGEFVVWPFFRRPDYEAALRDPKLLRRAV
jgi:hypothetical protein